MPTPALPQRLTPLYRPWRSHLAGTRNTYPGFNCRHAPMTLAIATSTEYYSPLRSLPTANTPFECVPIELIMYTISNTHECNIR